jgi:Raf kinase inhibitor-like YbhB/YbcL family protein
LGFEFREANMKSFRAMWAFVVLFAACSPTEGSEVVMSNMTLTSAAFSDGGAITNKYTYSLGSQCSGDNYSPPLAWTGAPEGTRSFAILVLDPDGRNWVHWLQFNIPTETTQLPEAVGGPNTGGKGVNDFGGIGYGGPCPPSGMHRYIFTLYALDTTLSLSEGASRAQFESAIKGHVLGTAQLTGLRSR